MKALALLAFACVTLSACEALARYPPPPAGSFTATNARISADGVSQSTPGAIVTPDFFQAYKMQPMLGRMFIAPADYAQGANRLVLLSEDLWRKRFGAQPDVIGRTIDIDGAPTTVIGVIPFAFQLPPDAKFWLTSRQ